MNYKLTLQYDGTNYSGWQIQRNAPSIQGALTDAIELLVKEPVNLIGSGRTDTGVHAVGQIANFNSGIELDIPKFQHSLNSILRSDVAVSSIDIVPQDFHSRYDARKRIYVYYINFEKSPFFDRYAYCFPAASEFDINQLNQISNALMGDHDFTSFSKKDSEKNNKFCSVFDIKWRRKKRGLIFKIEANRFLHGMVRTIVGSVLHAVKSNYSNEYIPDVLSRLDRKAAAEAVPAKGLFLYRVEY